MKCSRHYTFSVLPKSKEITISFLSSFIGVIKSEYSPDIIRILRIEQKTV